MRNLIACLTILAIAGAASAAITVNAGTHTVGGDATGQTFQILISIDSLDVATACDLNVQFGSTAEGTPDITNVDLGTGIFSGVGTPTYTDGGPTYPGIGMADVLVGDPNNDPTLAGILATVTVDTTGFTSGSWTINLVATLNSTSLFRFTSGSPSVTWNAGTFTVPEPATLALLGLGSLGVLIRRRRR